MNNIQDITEGPSLLEVREWKEPCRQQTEHFTPEEDLNWIRATAEELITHYHLRLQVVHR